jgi:hypothetical protein
MSKDTQHKTTCGDCRFWDERHDNDGLCRRHSPRPIPEAMVMDRTTEKVNRYSAFPMTAIDDWCGDAEANQ